MLNATELVMIIDKSGSMDSCRVEAEQAINKFIESQSEDGSLTYFTLAEFSTVTSIPIKAEVLNKDKPPTYMLRPVGMTALYDAIGTVADLTGKRLASLPEDKRPDKVVVVIMTDGGENSSKEFNAEQIKNIVTRQESVYNWKFIYLGANQDAFAVGGTIGTQSMRTSGYNTRNFVGACNSTSEAVTNYKMGLMGDVSFSEKQRSAIEKDSKNV